MEVGSPQLYHPSNVNSTEREVTVLFFMILGPLGCRGKRLWKQPHLVLHLIYQLSLGFLHLQSGIITQLLRILAKSVRRENVPETSNIQ